MKNNDIITIQFSSQKSNNPKPSKGSSWKLRTTRSVVGCDKCRCRIRFGKIDGAKHDQYYQKGAGKRLCPDCYNELPEEEK